MDSIGKAVQSALSKALLWLSGAGETDCSPCSAHSFWDGSACFSDPPDTPKQRRTLFPINAFKYTICSSGYTMPPQILWIDKATSIPFWLQVKKRTYYFNTNRWGKWKQTTFSHGSNGLPCRELKFKPCTFACCNMHANTWENHALTKLIFRLETHHSLFCLGLWDSPHPIGL